MKQIRRNEGQSKTQVLKLNFKDFETISKFQEDKKLLLDTEALEFSAEANHSGHDGQMEHDKL